jgi:hypothetical protein
MTLPSGGRVVFEESAMPTILDLLRSEAFAYSLLEVQSTVTLSKAERRIWVSLVVVGVIWGAVTVAAYTASSALLHPVVATMGFLAFGVLVVTVVLFGRQAEKRTPGPE